MFGSQHDHELIDKIFASVDVNHDAGSVMSSPFYSSISEAVLLPLAETEEVR